MLIMRAHMNLEPTGHRQTETQSDAMKNAWETPRVTINQQGKLKISAKNKPKKKTSILSNFHIFSRENKIYISRFLKEITHYFCIYRKIYYKTL